jgi:hypothetical protein
MECLAALAAGFDGLAGCGKAAFFGGARSCLRALRSGYWLPASGYFAGGRRGCDRPNLAF